jgi:hypothetical protein
MDAPIGGLPVHLGDHDSLVGMTMAEGGHRVEETEKGATIATRGQLGGVEAVVDAGVGTSDDIERLVVSKAEFLDGLVCSSIDVWRTMPSGPIFKGGRELPPPSDFVLQHRE